MRTYLTSAVALFVAGTAVLVAVPQTTGPRNPPLMIRSLAGGDLFAFYCTTCHGRKGTGDGPVAAALKSPPPDLTLLARRNGGTFPRQRVEAFVTNGGDVLSPAHGSADMSSLNSMQSKIVTTPSTRAMFPRWRSPWHSRTKPLR